MFRSGSCSLKREGGDGPLAEVFLDLDLQAGQLVRGLIEDCDFEFAGDPGSEFLGGCVPDREYEAVFGREDPATVPETGLDFSRIGCHCDGGVVEGEEHAVIESVDDFLQAITEGDEVEDIPVFVERALDFGCHAPVVPMKSFANVSVVGDEVCGAEDEVVFGDADAKGGFSHG